MWAASIPGGFIHRHQLGELKGSGHHKWLPLFVVMSWSKIFIGPGFSNNCGIFDSLENSASSSGYRIFFQIRTKSFLGGIAILLLQKNQEVVIEKCSISIYNLRLIRRHRITPVFTISIDRIGVECITSTFKRSASLQKFDVQTLCILFILRSIFSGHSRHEKWFTKDF